MDDTDEDDGGLQYWQTTGQWQRQDEDEGYSAWCAQIELQRKEIEHEYFGF